MLAKKLLKNAWKNLFYVVERAGFHVYPVHYYSQLPDTGDLRRRKSQWSGRKDFPGLEVNPERWCHLFNEITSNFLCEYETFNSYEEEVRDFGWGGYGPIEAFVYYAMIRYFKPARIIEVGSGISSVYSLRALEANGKGDLVAIEPYPSDGLRKLAHENSRLTLRESVVQEIELDFFAKLKEQDFLFIDSTHTVKIGGDVNFLILDVLPRLNKGVVIHFHDIPWPKRTIDPFKDNMFWQEAEFLQAFLAFNSHFQILMAQKWLHLDYSEELKRAFSWYNPNIHSPSSVYLQRVA